MLGQQRFELNKQEDQEKFGGLNNVVVTELNNKHLINNSTYKFYKYSVFRAIRKLLAKVHVHRLI